MKGIEKKIFSEHKKHIGLTELDAKVLYTKTARSLPTYGVTFFLVKVNYEYLIFQNNLMVLKFELLFSGKNEGKK